MSKPPDHDAPRHPIQVVARRTGLSPDVLRAWERRFGLVAPGRSESGRRLYSDADVERLRLLHRVTKEGWSIGRIASLPNDELLALLDDRPAPAVREHSAPSVDVFLAAALEAVTRYDAAALDTHLWRAVVALAPADFFDRVLAPLLVEIGDRWRRGHLQPAGEHIATAVIRRVLGRIGDAMESQSGTFRVVVGTPVGQMHDLGALLVAASAAAEGWAVTFVGSDLPAAELAATAGRTGARCVALSIVHPGDDGRIPAEMAELREVLPPEIDIVVGGAAAGAYERSIRAAGATLLPTLAEFRAYLRRLASARHVGRSA
jgi:DNA-binding transcriptional MerR regulator/methylmalonyl-CoA mutase cobalamin-binding subunit